MDLAENLIHLSGYTTDQIPITFTGIRPGEKMYEELLNQHEKAQEQIFPKIHIGHALDGDPYVLNRFIHEFDMMNEEQMRQALFAAIESHDMLSDQMTREEEALANEEKVLFCATVDYHFKAFHLPYFRWFQEQGWEVHTAANGQLELPYVNQAHSIPIQRSPFHVRNRLAYVELKKLLAKEHYDFIHCHTPMGSVIGRLAAKGTRKKGTKVLYTAHGFHFWQGRRFKTGCSIIQ